MACLVMGLFVMGGMLLASQWMRKDPESMQTVPLTGKDQDEQSEHSKSISLNFNQAEKPVPSGISAWLNLLMFSA